MSTISGSTSGSTNIDVHIFIDEYGNVTQTEKKSKSRLKYYIDPNLPQVDLYQDCVIGLIYTGENSVFIPGRYADCINGIALGVGDTKMSYAAYSNSYILATGSTTVTTGTTTTTTAPTTTTTTTAAPTTTTTTATPYCAYGPNNYAILVTNFCSYGINNYAILVTNFCSYGINNSATVTV